MIDQLSEDQYALWFDVRRSVRYHDRRLAFFTLMHRITGVLTILLSGSIIFDIARPGGTPWWLAMISFIAAILAAIDFVVGYASCATTHHDLRTRWSSLEIEMIEGGKDEATWQQHRVRRLLIEKDEPPIYRALDLLCHNELLVVDGHCKLGEETSDSANVSNFQRWTSHLYRWPNIASS